MTRAIFSLVPALVAGLSACAPLSHEPKSVVHVADVPLVIQPVEMDMGDVMEGKEASATLFFAEHGGVSRACRKSGNILWLYNG